MGSHKLILHAIDYDATSLQVNFIVVTDEISKKKFQQGNSLLSRPTAG